MVNEKVTEKHQKVDKERKRYIFYDYEREKQKRKSFKRREQKMREIE